MSRNKKSLGEKQNLWPDLPQQLIDLLATKWSLMEDIHSKGVMKSWRTQSTKCRSGSPSLPWLDLQLDSAIDHSQPQAFNIPFKASHIWYWHREPERPNIITGHHFVCCSKGLLVVKRVSDLSGYALWEPYPYCRMWRDTNVPFLSAAFSACPWTAQDRRINKSTILVLTGTSSPAFVYYKIWEGDQGWVKKDTKMVDPHCSNPNRGDRFFRFSNGVWLKEKFYALSIQGTVVVIEDIGNDFRITKVGKRVVPSMSSMHYRECLVEFEGKIFLVFLVSKNRVNRVDYVEVYELDTDELSWIKKENLGDVALFLGVHCCMGVQAIRVGCKKNCIYFSIRYGDGWWLYDMETRIISIVGTTKFVDWLDPQL